MASDILSSPLTPFLYSLLLLLYQELYVLEHVKSAICLRLILRMWFCVDLEWPGLNVIVMVFEKSESSLSLQDFDETGFRERPGFYFMEVFQSFVSAGCCGFVFIFDCASTREFGSCRRGH